MLTIAKILLTLTVLGYALVTIKADFNKTHATNPKWTPHARFHVVWQILSYSGVGLIALYLIWSDGPNPMRAALSRGRHQRRDLWRVLRRGADAAAVRRRAL